MLYYKCFLLGCKSLLLSLSFQVVYVTAISVLLFVELFLYFSFISLSSIFRFSIILYFNVKQIQSEILLFM